MEDVARTRRSSVAVEIWTPRDEADRDELLSAVSRLDLTVALSAIEGAPPAVRKADWALLSDWGTETAYRAGKLATRTPIGEARILKEMLGDELRFGGGGPDYHAVENSYLHQVLSLRHGMPILLACVFIEVGRRAGIHVEGVGMPRHFIARVGESAGVLVDPWNGGLQMTREGCRRLLEKLSERSIPWKDEYLRATPVPEIVERVLQNLVYSAHRAGDAPGLYRAVSFLTALRPDSPSHILQKAATAASLGLWDVAETAYRLLVDEYPEAPEAERAASGLETLGREGTVN